MSLDWLLRPQLEAFACAGYEVIGASAPGPHVGALERAGIRHEPVRHATRSMAPGRDLLALAELVALFRRLEPDIVHTHNPKPGVYGRLAARIAGVPVVVNTVHGLYALPEDPLPKRYIVYALERLAGRASDAELIQNPEDVETLLYLGIGHDKVRLLGNGVDLARFDPGRIDARVRDGLRREAGIGSDEVVAGLVGRLVWEKGYAEVFAAAAYLRRRHHRLRFVVIGPSDPTKGDAVDPRAIDAARRDGVVFLGARDDVDAWYTAMDLYVLASHREGFPRSAMEAAAMGLPIVATDVRGCRQVVEDGSNGLSVPARDSVGLAEAIGTLVADRKLREAMGRAGRARARTEFDQKRVIDTTLDTYERLLDARSQ